MSKYKQQKIYFDKPYHSICIWRKPYDSPNDVAVLRTLIVSREEYDSHKEEHGTGWQWWLNTELRPQFQLAVCVEGGTVRGHEFKVGEVYPIVGTNNGVHIVFETDGREDKYAGDPHDLLCHTWDVNAPMEVYSIGGSYHEFIDQDGTVPPLFQPIDLKELLYQESNETPKEDSKINLGDNIDETKLVLGDTPFLDKYIPIEWLEHLVEFHLVESHKLLANQYRQVLTAWRISGAASYPLWKSSVQNTDAHT